MIVFDASTIVGAALRQNSVPERALLKARREDVIAISAATEAEIIEVLQRPKLARGIHPDQRERVLDFLLEAAERFVPTVAVHDCRDAKDNEYLELALAAGAARIIGSDDDLLTLSPWRGVQILRPAEYAALENPSNQLH